MSLLKNILSPFVEFTDEKKKEAPKDARTTPVENKAASGNAPVSPSAPDNANNVNIPPAPVNLPQDRTGITLLPEHEKHFDKLIEEANAKNPLFQGADFKEFIESKEDIEGIADEATRYRTAFSVLKRTGLTKEKLLSTGQEYMNLIGREMNAFQSAYAQQYQKEIRQREQLIQKKAEEVQALSERIKKLNEEMKQLSQEIAQTKSKMDAAKNSFLLAGENKQQEIQSELQKITQYF